MNFQQLGEGIASLADTPIIVDISPFVGKPRGEVVLTWGEPSASGIYEIATLAVEIKKKKLRWDDQLCIDVATLSVCHRAPDPGDAPPAELYMKIAEKNSRCWQFLVLRLNEELPHLKGVKFLNSDGTQDTASLKNFLCGSSNSAPAGSEDATRSNSDTSPVA
jgi:hypothetical protein